MAVHSLQQSAIKCVSIILNVWQVIFSSTNWVTNNKLTIDHLAQESCNIECLVGGDTNFDEVCKHILTFLVAEGVFEEDIQKMKIFFCDMLPRTVLKDIWEHVIIDNFEQNFLYYCNVYNVDLADLPLENFTNSSIQDLIIKRKRNLLEMMDMLESFKFFDFDDEEGPDEEVWEFWEVVEEEDLNWDWI